VRRELVAYGRQRWDADKLARRMQALADWAAAHRLTVWIGEFGVNRGAPRQAAYRWWHDMRVAANRRHIRWCTWFWWDWAATYGTQGEGDQDLAAALGLPRL
jgi:hypothetical protein